MAHALQKPPSAARGRRPGVATRSPAPLVALLATLGCAGCIWPSDIQEREPIGNPPVVDRTRIAPSPETVVELTSLTTDFSVAGAVTDPDTDLDALEYHWYLGYMEWTEPKPPDFTGYSAIRLNACAFQDELSPPGSSHTLELFISDGPIVFDRERGRTILGGYAYVSWTIRSQVACQ